MGKAIKAKDIKSGDRYDARRESVRRGKRRAEAGSGFREKTFADLTGDEKDDLLKALAIKTGLIAE